MRSISTWRSRPSLTRLRATRPPSSPNLTSEEHKPMRMHALRRRAVGLGALIVVVIVALSVLLSRQTPAAAPGGSYLQTNIVSDVKGTARVTDPNLINPWGIVSGANTPFWIADNNAGVSTIYTATGGSFAGAPTSVAIPSPTGSPASAAGAPTGVVFNGSSSFIVRQGRRPGPASSSSRRKTAPSRAGAQSQTPRA